MSGYPIQLITDYRAGKISRQQFIKQFSDWQKSRGINYDCKGTASKNGITLAYRGIRGIIKNGVIQFSAVMGNKKWCCMDQRVKSQFEFCRRIDFAKNQEDRTWN